MLWKNLIITQAKSCISPHLYLLNDRGRPKGLGDWWVVTGSQYYAIHSTYWDNYLPGLGYFHFSRDAFILVLWDPGSLMLCRTDHFASVLGLCHLHLECCLQDHCHKSRQGRTGSLCNQMRTQDSRTLTRPPPGCQPTGWHHQGQWQ